MKNRQRKPRRVEIDLSTHPGRHHKPVKLCEKLEGWKIGKSGPDGQRL